MFIHCPGDQLKANRHSCVYASSSRQDVALREKTAPHETALGTTSSAPCGEQPCTHNAGSNSQVGNPVSSQFPASQGGGPEFAMRPPAVPPPSDSQQGGGAPYGQLPGPGNPANDWLAQMPHVDQIGTAYTSPCSLMCCYAIFCQSTAGGSRDKATARVIVSAVRLQQSWVIL